jgi:diketogulonate reductase-like aldo/keto reductase
MAQLTIQVPDELANRLQPILHRLPELLSQLIETHTPETLTLTNSSDTLNTYTEVLDFLIKQPTPEQIAKFKVSTPAQTRLEYLLEKNRMGTISKAENSELDIYEQLEQLMILLKARAYSVIKNDK